MNQDAYKKVQDQWRDNKVYLVAVQEIATTGKVLLASAIERSAVLLEAWKMAYDFVLTNTKDYDQLNPTESILLARRMYQAILEIIYRS